MTRIRTLLAGSVALALLAAPAAMAQQAPTPEAPAATTAPPSDADADPCKVVPGDGQAATSLENPEQDTAGAGESSLSATLDRCGGVLTPPAVGDPAMVAPAPDAGVTPIIPPSALPEDE